MWRMLKWLTLLAIPMILCNCGGPQACTLVGAVSGVQVTGGGAGASLRICAGSSCGTGKFVGGSVFVPLSELRPGRAVDLEVTVKVVSRRVVSHATVVPVKSEPNGPGCAPTAAIAELRLDQGGQAQ